MDGKKRMKTKSVAPPFSAVDLWWWKNEKKPISKNENIVDFEFRPDRFDDAKRRFGNNVIIDHRLRGWNEKKTTNVRNKKIDR